MQQHDQQGTANGASLGYRHLGGHVSEPQTENFNPSVEAAYSGPMDIFDVVPDRQGVVESNAIPPISLLRQSNPSEAYAILTSRRPISLDHHYPGWGVVKFAVVYPRSPTRTNCFVCPTDTQNQEHVVIKVLNKAVVTQVLQNGNQGADNPYKEVQRMRELNDERYVLSCIDFLEDENYLYIVTPRGVQTLSEVVHWGHPDRAMPTLEALKIFRQLLGIVDYLQSRGINHHDLSPDNLLLMPNGRIVAFDFAKSLRMPVNSNTGNRGLMHHASAFGTIAWMCPEVYRQFPYDGSGMDLWAACLIFYNMLTNYFLYETPTVTDHRFLLFIVANGLQDIDANELAIEVIDDLLSRLSGSDDGRSTLRALSEMADVHIQMEPPIRNLMASVFNVNPAERPTLAQVMESISTFIGER